MRVKNTQRKMVTPSSFQSMEGAQNACTTIQDTNYHFDINADSFDEALDRFAQFFIKPLMSADATMREIKFVDSENMDTLHARPEAKGMDTRTELIKFYEEHYSANIMHLVVYGKKNLDIIQGLVEKKFQEIRNTNKHIPRFPGQPCAPDHFQILVKAVPTKQGHSLTISWPVTLSIHHYEEALCRYLTHLIGHKGDGSLFHALKIMGRLGNVTACW